MASSKTLPVLLIVDDEKATREGLRQAFEEDFDIYTAPDVKSALNILDGIEVDLLLTDLRLGSESGMKLLEKAQTLTPRPACIMMTAYGSVDNAVEAMRRGAYDYVMKPLDIDRLSVILKRAIKDTKADPTPQPDPNTPSSQNGDIASRIVGESPALTQILKKARQVAASRATVLIEGESGTGKELIARAIHQWSARKDGPLVTVHCAALSPQLLESELFGHERGAFTGAIERRIGRFEEASGGTLFLDEIGEIDASTQVKLLRALGERIIQRVGGNQEIPVDVRVVAATNRNLEAMMQEGKFREDLFYRLSVVRLYLPPLRERKEDIPQLVKVFLRDCARENGKPTPRLADGVIDILMRYNWPGNIRELRMAIEHGVVLAEGGVLRTQDLPERIVAGASGLLQYLENGSKETVPLGKEESQTASSNPFSLEEQERRSIAQALRACGGNRTQAAEKLGISRRTLYRKLKEYGWDLDKR
ncbi:MAG: sigma-54 dependent transcriptional regulator [Methylacidiphilales bacterium]|nr:sigma-54 dependent transcriptional regulator [Candidatus Methylacidiphilales bacterium]MDW8349260.1 sigma-54 dependent transcriptional regulator [Verrucomicrobiae bacterium]